MNSSSSILLPANNGPLLTGKIIRAIEPGQFVPCQHSSQLTYLEMVWHGLVNGERRRIMSTYRVL